MVISVLVVHWTWAEQNLAKWSVYIQPILCIFRFALTAKTYRTKLKTYKFAQNRISLLLKCLFHAIVVSVCLSVLSSFSFSLSPPLSLSLFLVFFSGSFVLCVCVLSMHLILTSVYTAVNCMYDSSNWFCLYIYCMYIAPHHSHSLFYCFFAFLSGLRCVLSSTLYCVLRLFTNVKLTNMSGSSHHKHIVSVFANADVLHDVWYALVVMIELIFCIHSVNKKVKMLPKKNMEFLLLPRIWANKNPAK